MKYSKSELIHIQRKLKIHTLKRELSPDMNMIYLAYSSLLAALVTIAFTYITAEINNVLFHSDKYYDILEVETTTIEEKTQVLEVIWNEIRNFTGNVHSDLIKYMGLFFILTILISAMIFVYQYKKMYERRIYKLVIDECIEELEIKSDENIN